MRQIEATHMAQLDPFELLPEPFARVQLRRIGWQALQMQSLCCTVGQELFDYMAAMNRGIIPNDDYTAGHFPQQMIEKGDHICRIEGAVLAGEIQLPLGGHSADGREMIPGPPLPQDRRVSHRGVGADDTGQGIEAGLIYKEDRLLLGLGPLLRAGQVSSRQRAIAASSRWRARRAGFCGLQRSALSKRPTWAGW